jgi:hypothetical protein
MEYPSHSGENRPATFLQQAVCQRVMALKSFDIFAAPACRNKQMLTFYPDRANVCRIRVQMPFSQRPRVLNLFAN